MKSAIVLLGLLLSVTASAAEVKLTRVKVLGDMKVKVIFQSTDVKKVAKTNSVRGKIVAQWGTQVFEVVNAFYSCNSKNVCKLEDYERVATYSLCKVAKDKSKVACTGKIAGSIVTNSSDVVVVGNPDEVNDSLNSSDNRETDFPVRIEDEFSDIF